MYRLKWDWEIEFWKVEKVVGPFRKDDGPWYDNYWCAYAAMLKANDALRKFDIKHGIR
jgi:hypothetical protein